MTNKKMQNKENVYKKQHLFFSVIAAILLLAGLAQASIVISTLQYISPGNVDLLITKVNQDPDPAGPGGYVDLRLKVENRGSKNADNVTIEILPDYPFSLYETEGATKNIGGIGGSQMGDQGAIIKFRLKVDKNAVEGENEIKIRYKTSNDGPLIMPPAFNISIKPRDIVLDVVSIETNPSRIAPGQLATVQIKLKNLANAVVQDIKVKLGLDSATMPFVPVNSINEKTIAYLDANQEKILTFDIMAEPTAAAGAYKLPIDLTYSSLTDKNYSKSYITGLIVGGAPDLFVVLDSSKIYSVPSTGKITIKVVNRGTMDIKFMTLQLGNSDKYDILSSQIVYLGKVDSDDYETADYTIHIKKTDNKEVKLPITLVYTDANNAKYHDQQEIALKVYSAQELGQNKGMSAGTIIVLALIVAGTSYYLYTKFKRKKK